MVVGEARLIRVDMSTSCWPNGSNSILGCMIGYILTTIENEEMIYLRIIGSSKSPKCYSILLLATDLEWRTLIKTIKETCDNLAEIKFYNVKSGMEKEEES